MIILIIIINMIKKLCYININIIVNNNYSDEDYDHDPLWHFQLLDGPWLTNK